MALTGDLLRLSIFLLSDLSLSCDILKPHSEIPSAHVILKFYLQALSMVSQVRSVCSSALGNVFVSLIISSFLFPQMSLGEF